MEVVFKDVHLDRLETDASETGGHPPSVVKSFRKKMQAIRQVADERDIRAMKSWHFEKLSGRRDHQCSIKLNDQWRLILEFEGVAPDKQIVVVAIEDYHK